jgi:hypothetical protein
LREKLPQVLGGEQGDIHRGVGVKTPPAALLHGPKDRRDRSKDAGGVDLFRRLEGPTEEDVVESLKVDLEEVFASQEILGDVPENIARILSATLQEHQ